MQRLEVSGAVRPIYGSLGVRRLKTHHTQKSLLCPRSTERTTSMCRFPCLLHYGPNASLALVGTCSLFCRDVLDIAGASENQG